MANNAKNAPGVIINEIDMSEVPATVQESTVGVAFGFSQKGRSLEPMVATTQEEVVSNWGQPTNEAERYFVHSLIDVVNETGAVIGVRLPYGDADEIKHSAFKMTFAAPSSGVSADYGLAAGNYTVLSSVITGTNAMDGTQATITDTELTALAAGDRTTSLGGTLGQIGIGDILFVNRSVDNAPNGDGDLYLAIIDSFTAATPATRPTWLADTVPYVNSAAIYGEYDNSKIVDVDIKSVSSAAWAGIQNVMSKDSISVILFRYNASSQFQADRGTMTIVERYDVSLDPAKTDSYGNTLFIEDVINNNSTRIRAYTGRSSTADDLTDWAHFSDGIVIQKKPTIANSTTVTGNNLVVQDKVYNDGGTYKRAYGVTLATHLVTEVISPTSVKVSPLGDGNRTYSLSHSKMSRENMIIGDVNAKLVLAMPKIANPQQVPLDLLVDAGLSTIAGATNATSLSPSGSYYGPTYAMDRMYEFTNHIVLGSTFNTTNYDNIIDQYHNFANLTRKDVLVLIDIPRQYVVSGQVGMGEAMPGRVEKYIVGDESGSDGVSYNDCLDKVLNDRFNRDCGSYSQGVLASSYLAVYGNWVKMRDRYNKGQYWHPVSSKVAAVIGKMSKQEEPWFAPAGIDRATIPGALQLAINPTPDSQGVLYKRGINNIINLPAYGTIVWGQKTLLTTTSAFSRINVRLLFLVLEKRISRIMYRFVFKNNTYPTRTRVVDAIKPLLDYAKSKEGLNDFLLVCDETNNTPEVLEKNELVVDLALDAARTGEFIIINMIASRVGANLTEVIRQKG
jgi:hypothetical protein